MAAVKIPILYEDNHLLAAVKPPGILSQADAGGDADMLTLLKKDIGERYRKPGRVYLGLVHRLDRPVGGVMIFARTSKAAARLSEQAREGVFRKRYVAVSCGRPPEGEMVHHLLKDGAANTSRAVPEAAPGARRAALICRVLAERGGLTLCQIDLVTGRSHQIRVQLAASGCPLWGDRRYNPSSRSGQSVALWAREVVLVHPTARREMRFGAPAPCGEPWDLFADLLR